MEGDIGHLVCVLGARAIPVSSMERRWRRLAPSRTARVPIYLMHNLREDGGQGAQSVMAYDETTAPQRRKWPWIAGSIVLFLAACAAVLAFAVPRFQATLEASRAQAIISAQLVEDVTRDWDGDVLRAVWSSEVDLSGPDLARLMSLGAQFGAASSTGDPVCGWRAYAGTEELNGTFIDCALTADHGDQPANYTIGWRKEEGVYKLYNFRVQFPDMPGDADAAIDDPA